MKAVLVPFKSRARAKQRLATALNDAQRAALAWAMLEDVLDAVCRSAEPALRVLVSQDEQALLLAASRGWRTLAETAQSSESDSVDQASLHLECEGVTRLLRLPGDVPLLTPGDVDSLFRLADGAPCAVAVPSRDGTGTNALLRTPPSAFPSRFGSGSLALHRALAEARGIRWIVAENRRLALDVDDPGDLQMLIDAGVGGATGRCLAGWPASGGSEPRR